MNKTPATEHSVLLVSRRRDAECAVLASCLRRIGVSVRGIHADELHRVSIAVDLEDSTLTIGRDRFRATVTWLRHFSMRAAPRQRRGSADHMFYRDAWTALARQLPLVSGAVIGHRQPGPLEQLLRAKELGLRTPRTVVTNDLAEIERLTGARHVVKALGRHFVEPAPGALSWYLPRICGPTDRSDSAAFAGAPVILQEYVPHEAELRVYLIGGEVHAFRVRKDRPDDLWHRPDRVDVHCVTVPAPVEEAVRALARAWNINYGAFDFLVGGDEPVFLEVNADGDWRWFERRAGVAAVTDAAVRTVLDLHRSTTTHTAAPAGVRALDLLAFLGAGSANHDET